MNRRVWGLAAAIALICAPRCLAAPLAAYGALPAIEQVAISPDGAKLAIVLTNGELRNVAIETVADQKVIMTIRAGEKKLRDIRWA